MPRARRNADAWYWAMVDMWPRLSRWPMTLYIRETTHRRRPHR